MDFTAFYVVVLSTCEREKDKGAGIQARRWRFLGGGNATGIAAGGERRVIGARSASMHAFILACPAISLQRQHQNRFAHRCPSPASELLLPTTN